MDSEKIGKIIFENRRSLGLSQEELGEKIGVSDKTISKWETGICVPDKNNLKKVADLFGISLVALMNGKCENEEKKSEDIKIKEMVDLDKLQQSNLKKDHSTDKVDIKKSQKKNIKIIICFLVIFLIVSGSAFLIHCFHSNDVEVYDIYPSNEKISVNGSIVIKNNVSTISLFNIDTTSEDFIKKCYYYDYSVYIGDNFIYKYEDIDSYTYDNNELFSLDDVLRNIKIHTSIDGNTSKIYNNDFINIVIRYIDENYETQMVSISFAYKKV